MCLKFVINYKFLNCNKFPIVSIVLLIIYCPHIKKKKKNIIINKILNLIIYLYMNIY